MFCSMISGERHLELGVAYPIVDSNTQANLTRCADTNIPTFTTHLGLLNGVSTLIRFRDQLGALPGLNHEGEQRLAPWIDKPLGEVSLHISTLENGLSVVHRAPLDLTVVSFIPNTEDQEALVKFLRLHKAELLLADNRYILDLLHFAKGSIRVTEFESGNIRDKKGMKKEILLPDTLPYLANGSITFIND